MEIAHTKGPAYSPESNGLAERINATLKRRLYKYLTENYTRRYVQALDRLVSNYNNTQHRVTKHTPTEVFAGRANYLMQNRANPHHWPLLQPGDKVRVSQLLNPQWKKNIFVRKHYLPRWTTELYTIQSRSPDGLFYTLQEVGRKRYKAQDLQLVNEQRLIRKHAQRIPFDQPPIILDDPEAPNIPAVPRAPRPDEGDYHAQRPRRMNAGVDRRARDYLAH
jgi:hypothetical protein